jgi:hypothetical protein
MGETDMAAESERGTSDEIRSVSLHRIRRRRKEAEIQREIERVPGHS